MIGRVHLLPAHHKTEFLKRSREGFHHERRQVPLSNLAILRQINELHPAYVTGAKVRVVSFARGRLRDPIGNPVIVPVGPPIRQDGAAL